jgi:hypothetical protein
MSEQTSSANPKRRGRKPRGGIASLSEILAFQQQPIAAAVDMSIITPIAASTASMDKKTATTTTTTTTTLHHHTLDFDLAHWNHHSTTPQAMQIQNFQKSTPQLSSSPFVARADPDEMADEDLDELDLFPGDDPVDFEVIFKTQTAASASRGLHMSQRDRDNLEVYRPQNASHGGGTSEMTSSEASTTPFVQIPEHMRIVSINFDGRPPIVDERPKKDVQQEEEVQQTKDALPDFFHPFRIHTYSPAVHAHQPSHALEDNISWPSRSPFACWWCRHTFETYPKVAPVWIRGDEVEVIGNFCTWNCTKAYCMKEFRRLDLFNTFYHKLFQAHANEVVPAPSFLTIDTFGGPLTIQNFRKTLNNPERQLQFDMFAHTHIRVSKMFITK